MMVIPDELRDVVTYPENALAPIIKPTATDAQKIRYADFISEYLVDNSFDDSDLFLFDKKKKD